jgi:hypothetical protein
LRCGNAPPDGALQRHAERDVPPEASAAVS